MKALHVLYSIIRCSLFRVYELHCCSFDCELVYEIPITPKNGIFCPDMIIRNDYLVLRRVLFENEYLIVNWRDGTYLLINGWRDTMVKKVC